MENGYKLKGRRKRFNPKRFTGLRPVSLYSIDNPPKTLCNTNDNLQSTHSSQECKVEKGEERNL